MPKNPSIYTRRGDKGRTSLLTGERIEKDNHRVEAYGTVDELNSCLGVAKAHSESRISEFIHKIQQRLFYITAELATSHDSEQSAKILNELVIIDSNDVTDLENLADELTEELPPLSNFIIPGGSKSAAFLHQARSTCRRAERRVISLSKSQPVRPPIIKYLNRLSDTIFVLARYANVVEGEGDFLISRDGVRTQKKND